ncbi:MAG TPA: MBL fold metallo-hydrolase [Chitinophagaceae bacterium]|nr:MBL fold metallo-hydrolase [Chitinophagaceae bacterium]
MKINFLGTGTSSGVPMIGCDCEVCKSLDSMDKRLRSSVLIEIDGFNIVIDTTPDFRFQMLRANVKNLNAILVTHPHKDHIGGMDDLRAFNFFQKRPIDVYASENTQGVIRNEFSYAFSEMKYPGCPEINLHTIQEQTFNIEGISIIPIKVLHYKMPVLGFRIGNFTYITDANQIDQQEKQKIMGSKVLVLNALRKEKHISHFNIYEAIGISRELGIPQTYFTHISHQLGLYQEVDPLLPEGIHLAYDKLELEIL